MQNFWKERRQGKPKERPKQILHAERKAHKKFFGQNGQVVCLETTDTAVRFFLVPDNLRQRFQQSFPE